MSVETWCDSLDTWHARVTPPNTAEHARQAILDELRQRVATLAEHRLRLVPVYIDAEETIYREYWNS